MDIGGSEVKELEKQLMEAPAIREHKAMRERPSLIGNAKWYDKLFYNWVFDVIQVSISILNHQLTITTFSMHKPTSSKWRT